MLQGLGQPLTLCGSQGNFSQGWLSLASLPASVAPAAEASPGFLQPSAANTSIAAASHRAAHPSWGYRHPRLPKTGMERCGPESRNRDAKAAGCRDAGILQRQSGRRGK